MGDGVICDLVLLTWNRRDLLEPCVQRLLEHTQLPSRLIIVDHGSTDPDALAFLETVRGTPAVDVMVIRLEQQRSIAAALNAGLARTEASWICLLNNDILVTAGWLEELIRVAEANPQLGLVNPMSNHFNVDPRRGESIDAIAERLQQHRGQWLEASGCVGFCMLIPRRVFERVGYWDEAFAPMYFEDADYCLRVRQAGFDCGIAEGAYVYHHHNATIRHDPLREERFRTNKGRFDRKWPGRQPPQRIACLMPHRNMRDGAPDCQWVRRLANAGHKVWVFGPASLRVHIPRHLQIRVEAPRWCNLPLYFTGRILLKKKHFHQILSSSAGWRRFLRWLQPIHRARVRDIPPLE